MATQHLRLRDSSPPRVRGQKADQRAENATISFLVLRTLAKREERAPPCVSACGHNQMARNPLSKTVHMMTTACGWGRRAYDNGHPILQSRDSSPPPRGPRVRGPNVTVIWRENPQRKTYAVGRGLCNGQVCKRAHAHPEGVKAYGVPVSKETFPYKVLGNWAEYRDMKPDLTMYDLKHTRKTWI